MHPHLSKLHSILSTTLYSENSIYLHHHSEKMGDICLLSTETALYRQNYHDLSDTEMDKEDKADYGKTDSSDKD